MKYRDVPIYERKTITRRRFLKGVGIGLGALAVPTLALAASSEPSVEPEVVGYQGQEELDAGYFYAPYVPLMYYKCGEYGNQSSTMGDMVQFKTRYDAPVAQR